MPTCPRCPDLTLRHTASGLELGCPRCGHHEPAGALERVQTCPPSAGRAPLRPRLALARGIRHRQYTARKAKYHGPLRDKP